jgi:hypothetical protein
MQLRMGICAEKRGPMTLIAAPASLRRVTWRSKWSETTSEPADLLSFVTTSREIQPSTNRARTVIFNDHNVFLARRRLCGETRPDSTQRNSI